MPFNNADDPLFVAIRAFETGDRATLSGGNYSISKADTDGFFVLGAYQFRNPALPASGSGLDYVLI